MVEDLRPPKDRTAMHLDPAIGRTRDKSGTSPGGKGPGAGSTSGVGEKARVAPFAASRGVAGGSVPKRPANPFTLHIRARHSGLSVAAEGSSLAEFAPSDRKGRRVGWEQIERKWAAMTGRAQSGTSLHTNKPSGRPLSKRQSETGATSMDASADPPKPKAPPVR